MSEETAVQAMLAAAGLDVPPDELAELVAGYPALRAGLDLLYRPGLPALDPYLVPTVGADRSRP